jgi:hypothetical protein
MGPFKPGWTEAEVEAILAIGNPEDLLYAPIVVGMSAPGCDRAWAEGICSRLAEHSNFNVRGNAVLGFGHIARTCRALNLSVAVPIISQALNDPHEFVRGQAECAAEDIQTYLNVSIEGAQT